MVKLTLWEVAWLGFLGSLVTLIIIFMIGVIALGACQLAEVMGL